MAAQTGHYIRQSDRQGETERYYGGSGISFVLVYKLSRFGGNAADVLNTLQIMQDFGVRSIRIYPDTPEKITVHAEQARV